MDNLISLIIIYIQSKIFKFNLSLKNINKPFKPIAQYIIIYDNLIWQITS